MKKTELIKAILKKSIYESLNKALVKLNTNSVVDLEELHAALKTVPKSIIMFLMRELSGMEKNETREITLPWHHNSYLNITKQEDDVYKGRIVKDAHIVHNFDLTAIPQLGAHIMSAFELYSPEEDEDSLSISSSSSSSSHSDDDIKRKLFSLEDKVNTLFSVMARQRPEFIKKEVNLEKAGVMPTMPPPRSPGTGSGSKGTAKTGIAPFKKPGVDNKAKPKLSIKDPAIEAAKRQIKRSQLPSVPKPPTAIKTEKKQITFSKSELSGKCIDCGADLPICACFRALSRPEFKKTENSVTLKFKEDWDMGAIKALYLSIVRSRNE